MFTGKRPTHEMFNDGLNLHNHVKMALTQNLMHVADPTILQRVAAEDNYECSNYLGEEEITEEKGDISMKHNHSQIDAKMHECLVSVFQVGLTCSVKSPRERITMEVVTRELLLIRNAFIGACKLKHRASTQ